MHKSEPIYTLAAIDPLWVEVRDPDFDYRRRNVWVSRSPAVAPGNLVQLKYDKYLTIQRYDEKEDKYVATERSTYGGGGRLHGPLSWMNELGRPAVFLWPAGDGMVRELPGYIAEKMTLTVGAVYNIYGHGDFVHTGLRNGRDPIFVARKNAE